MVRVVGVAVVRVVDGQPRVLAARRTRPPELAGRWELPGGKCAPGESLTAAASRELAEELGVHARVGAVLAGCSAVRPGVTLQVVLAETEDDPVPMEHDTVRWVGAEELAELDWLEPDRPFLAEIAAVLSARAGALP